MNICACVNVKKKRERDRKREREKKNQKKEHKIGSVSIDHEQKYLGVDSSWGTLALLGSLLSPSWIVKRLPSIPFLFMPRRRAYPKT